MARLVVQVIELSRGHAESENSDQFFFKKTFWEDQSSIALDYDQVLFGNFLEIREEPCENGWAAPCAIRPCCTASDNFWQFASVFAKYQVQGCSVWRFDNLPVSWHGNGAGKWMYLIALDRLALTCGPAAAKTIREVFS